MMYLQNSNSNLAAKATENASEISKVAYSSIHSLLINIVEQLPTIAAGIVVLIIFLIFARILRSVFWAASNRAHIDKRLRILISRLIGITIFVLGSFAALTIIIPGFSFGNLIAGLGFTSFIIGFATKDILNNLLSGVLILWKQPFQVGDYIFVKSNEGNVEYIGVRATRLKKDDGEMVLIPNGEMYSNALTIRGAGANRRMKLKISISFDADIDRAKQIIRDALDRIEGIEKKPSPMVVLTELTGDGAGLSMYFWVDSDQNSPLQVFDQAASAVKKSLGEADIELFPASTILVRNVEKDAGKYAGEEKEKVF